eukprot:4057888-Pyramimonas_sp.AAC.1
MAILGGMTATRRCYGRACVKAQARRAGLNQTVYSSAWGANSRQRRSPVSRHCHACHALQARNG